jgi:class 3 adenylate cyclase
LDIAAWLRDLGLERYVEAFEANDVDAAVLRTLNVDDLRELGVTSLGHRKKLLEAIAAIIPQASPAPVADAPAAASATPIVRREAERRQLTVMFVDLVGSTELASHLDPEDLGLLIRAYQNCCAEVVKRWDGHVAKYMGDGVLAYFGWPQAHEDDPERAVRAGLDLAAHVGRLTTNHGAALSARIGIATGRVVVGDLIGEGPSREEAVIGETPNLAARLQNLAEPGSVVIAPATRRMVGGLFELADLGEHDLKGFGNRVRAWRIIGESRLASRFEAQRGLHATPLVGRERELEALEEARREAGAGRGQIVAAVGEPGVGKSRLFDAFLRSDAVAGWRVLNCACLSYGSITPWLPVIELVKRYFRVEDSDDQDRTAAKIAGKLNALAAMTSARTALHALLRLQIEDAEWQELNPPQRRRRILDAVKALLLLESKREPFVLVIEDLHWADGETVALLDSLIDSLPTHRMLVLVNYRPEFQHAWGGRDLLSAASDQSSRHRRC